MNPKEAGFLLLTSHLGDPCRRPLSVYQFHDLSQRMQAAPRPEWDGEVDVPYLVSLGYGKQMADRILALLADGEVLHHYLQKGRQWDCAPLSRVHPAYPKPLRTRLGLDAPGCVWMKGDVTLLCTPMIALVGSRDLRPENRRFAESLGQQAAVQGYTLVSGNARGADRMAQNACLEAGGRVISIVADALRQQPLQERVLYLSEDDYDAPFSAQRALSRNRCIHTLAEKTFVAQCTREKGGTWDGTVKNLRFGWSPVFVFDDCTDAPQLLSQKGAMLIGMNELSNLDALKSDAYNFLTGSV